MPHERREEPAIAHWCRSDRPGHEWARLRLTRAGTRLDGIAAFVHEGSAVRLEYAVRCGVRGRTRHVEVHGLVGSMPVDLTISRRAEVWRLAGRAVPDVAGCLDVDLAFSPSTNTLPIRRLALPVGASAVVRAAWLRFPELDLVPLVQIYRRTGTRTWRYESGGGSFARDLDVDDAGLVVRYPGLWERAAGGR